MVEYIIGEAGAEHSPKDRWGGTPFDDAVRHSHTAVVSYLEGVGAKRGKTALMRDVAAELCKAAASGDVEQLRQLIGGVRPTP